MRTEQEVRDEKGRLEEYLELISQDGRGMDQVFIENGLSLEEEKQKTEEKIAQLQWVLGEIPF